MHNRRFPIQTYGEDFVTGTCSDGRRVVMGLLCPHLVAYFFDAEGVLLGDEHRPWNTPAPRMRQNGPYQIYDPAFKAALNEQRSAWLHDLGFRPGPIVVREFMDCRHPVGITLLPDHLEEENADELDVEERTKIETSRAEWLANGQFVWWWAKDYWMSKDGEVEST